MHCQDEYMYESSNTFWGPLNVGGQFYEGSYFEQNVNIIVSKCMYITCNLTAKYGHKSFSPYDVCQKRTIRYF